MRSDNVWILWHWFIGFMVKGKSLLDYTNFLLMNMKRMIK